MEVSGFDVGMNFDFAEDFRVENYQGFGVGSVRTGC